jgi:hypothetical protein
MKLAAASSTTADVVAIQTKWCGIREMSYQEEDHPRCCRAVRGQDTTASAKKTKERLSMRGCKG